MNSKEFTNEIAAKIKDYLPEKYQDADVRIVEIAKDCYIQHGLTIRFPNQISTPIFYLDDYYPDFYANGDHFVSDGLMNVIARNFDAFYTIEMSNEHQISNIIENLDIINYSSIKSLLRPYLVNKDLCSDMLETLPHISTKDISSIVAIKLPDYRIKVTRDLLDTWNLDFNSVYRDAIANLNNEKFVLNSVEDRLFNCSSNNLINQETIRNKRTFFVLTTEKNVDGSVALLNSDVMNKINRLFPEGYNIIPSSIHECLIISNSMATVPELEEHLISVNNNKDIMNTDDILSYHIFTDKDIKNGLFVPADNDVDPIRERVYPEKVVREEIEDDELEL